MRSLVKLVLLGTLVTSSSFGETLKGELSRIAEKDQQVLRTVLSSGGVDSVTVSSRERTPAQQARVMYAHASKDMPAALKMYCSAGDAVLKSYNATATMAQNLKRMEEELTTQLPLARRLGCLNHVKNEQVYAVDIELSQIPEGKREALVKAGEAAVKARQVARFLYPPRDVNAYHFEFKRDGVARASNAPKSAKKKSPLSPKTKTSAGAPVQPRKKKKVAAQSKPGTAPAGQAPKK